MGKSTQKRHKEKLKRETHSNSDKSASGGSSGDSVPLKYVILVGLLCAGAGALLVPYAKSFLLAAQNGGLDLQKGSDPVPIQKRSTEDFENAGTVEENKDSPNGNEDVLVNLEPEVTDDKNDDVDSAGKLDLKVESIDDKIKSKPSTKTTEKISKKVKKSKSNAKPKKPELPKEIRDFKPTYLKELKPKKIFADGRRLPPIELLPQKPNNSSVRVYMFEEFLSDAECDGLRAAHDRHVGETSKLDPIVCFDSITTLRKHLKAAKKSKVKVTVGDFTDGTTCLNASFSSQFKTWIKSNWSISTAFYPGESKFSTIYEQRAKAATALPPENGGKFQITSYPLGIGYNTHTDCILENPDKRDRFATMLVYLETVEDGGETAFPDLGIWVKPKKGRALVWNNMNAEGECEPLSVHTAAKVNIGSKYILQRWYYYQSFYSLGKRPEEPQLPVREKMQPRVNCDEYEHGSCRWYDEWGYNHLLDYERQKLTLI